MTIPNVITIVRLILVPLIIVAIAQLEWLAAFAIFAAAGISDAVDGAIARRFDMRSELGAYLDPIADKSLLVSIYVTLAIVGVLPVWIAVLVVSRDLMIVAAIIVSWLMARPIAIKPLLISKLNTTAQIMFAGLLLAAKAFAVVPGPAMAVGLAVVATLTLASTAAYLAIWLKHMAS